MIDDELDKKVRLRQAKLIEVETKSVSYSKVINQLVKKGLT